MNDYSGEMRRGGRGGGGYRMPSSKDMGPGDMGPYSDKVSESYSCQAVQGVLEAVLSSVCMICRLA
jgi:hypothetical protein